MSNKILHISDSHINDNQYTNSSETPLGGLSLAVDLAIGMDIDAVVHSGNLFHYQSVQPDVVDAVKTQLRRLSDVGTDLLCIKGDKEYASQDNAFTELVEDGYINRLDTSAKRIGDIALFGINYVDTANKLKRRLTSLSPAGQSTHNAIVISQRLCPPCPPELADISATDFHSHTNIDISIILAGGMYEPDKWTAEGSNRTIIYPGATNPLTVAPGATITGTLIEAEAGQYNTTSLSLERSD